MKPQCKGKSTQQLFPQVLVQEHWVAAVRRYPIKEIICRSYIAPIDTGIVWSKGTGSSKRWPIPSDTSTARVASSRCAFDIQKLYSFSWLRRLLQLWTVLKQNALRSEKKAHLSCWYFFDFLKCLVQHNHTRHEGNSLRCSFWAPVGNMSLLLHRSKTTTSFVTNFSQSSFVGGLLPH